MKKFAVVIGEVWIEEDMETNAVVCLVFCPTNWGTVGGFRDVHWQIWEIEGEIAHQIKKTKGM
jgi:hypothetical protein